MKVLVAGGAGYIGSHTVVELIKAGHEAVIVDDLSNAKADVIDRIQTITGVSPAFYEMDCKDNEALRKVFTEHKIDAIIHFAAFKAVGESVQKPLQYYRNNLDTTLTLCEVMRDYGCKKIVFSSSATVYGSPQSLPIKEDFPLSTTNPYGSTKLYIEGILRDLYVSDHDWSIALLRYFNPIGAHPSGLIGENPNDIPNNLMPYIVKVANRELDILNVFGDDYDTEDGTGVRDYIHVVDLARGHLKAIEKVLNETGIDAYNLGTGHGYSVLQLIETFKKVNQIDVPYQITERRAGDIASCYADPSYAEEKLNWKAEKEIEEMCRDSYNYATN